MNGGTKQTTNRRRLLTTLGGGTAALLAGCLGSGGQQSNGGSTNVKFWTTQTENERLKVIRDLVGSFEKNHDPTVKMTSVKESDLPSQISSARASSTLPSIGGFGLGQMQKLGSGGLLSKKAAKNVISAVGEDKFYDGALSLTQAPDGGHFAVPFHGWLQGFWYSKSVWEEHGLDAPNSWDSILAAAKALHKPDSNQYGIVVGTKKTPFARQCFTPFARSNGARVFNENGDIVFDSDEMVEALDFYSKLAQYTPPGKDTWKTANNTYLNDQCQFVQYSTYLMGDITKEGEKMVKDTAFTPSIEKQRKSSFGQIVTLSMLSSAGKKERKASQEFAEYLMTGKQYLKWLHMAPGGMNPVLKPTAQNDAYKDNETLKAWGNTVEDISAGFANIERFGYVNGKSFPKLGDLTSQYLIAEAVSRVSGGEDPEKVATQQAEKMREAVKE
ncbi:ABC transporter substrate-binding protein [Halomicrococcus sp. NG-SE-24]|uniref:ABC transporter substrate-binding protein n=1 Tax=Halomicrococcus sp. NG-SE-24 TaxID=3436928 RepID=UPI003D98CF16